MHRIFLAKAIVATLEPLLAFGLPAKGDDFTMMHRTTDAPLEELDKERNRLIRILDRQVKGLML